MKSEPDSILAVGVFAMAPILCRWVSPAALPLTTSWGIIALVTLVIAVILIPTGYLAGRMSTSLAIVT